VAGPRPKIEFNGIGESRTYLRGGVLTQILKSSLMGALAAEWINHLMNRVVLTAGAAITLLELQQVGFHCTW
jgi:hypothetical protein